MGSCQKGRSMIEMLGVLAIVGVLSIGGIAGYSKAMVKVKTNRLISEMSELVMNIRTMFIGQNSFSTIDEALLIKSGAVPEGMATTSANIIYHAFGGKIKVFPSYVEADQLRAFELYMSDLNTLTCITLVTMDWGQEVSSGFQGLYVGTEVVEEAKMERVFLPFTSQPESGIYTPGLHDHHVPLTINDAASACSCDSVKCTVGLKYI